MGEAPVVARLGKYRLIAELGRGGMANVYLAVTEAGGGVQFNKLVVIKRLREHVAGDPEFVTMLVDEGRIAARLNHPNVVQMFEVGRDRGELFLAMEYLDGQPLHRILARARDSFPLEMHLAVLCDVLIGLQHAHDQRDFDGKPLHVIHRDVTPHNVFVTYDGQVKVVDFGIAKAEGRASETRHGTVKGKILYMAPEQARHLILDARVDVFAVGVMLYEACVRGRMWERTPDGNVVRSLQSGALPRSPRERAPDVHPELDRICQRALAWDRDERYATAEELATALEGFMREHLPRPSPRQLGAWLAELFEDRRRMTQTLIESQLADLNAQKDEVTLVAFPDSVKAPVDDSGAGPTKVMAPRPAPSGRPAPAKAPATEAPRSRSGRLGVLVGAALIALAVLGFSVMTRMDRSSARAGEGTTDEVTLIIRALPHEARFTVDDGAPVDNPYIARVKRDGREHRIVASAPGFATRTQTVSFTDDVSLRFTLAREGAGDGGAGGR